MSSDLPSPRGPALRASPLLRTLRIYLEELPGRTALTIGLYLLASAGFAWQQWLIGRAVNDVRSGRLVERFPDGTFSLHGAWRWLAILGGAALLRAILHYAAGAIAQVIGQQLMVKVRMRIFAQAQNLDLAYHWRHGAGELLTRTTRDSDKVRDALVIFWRQVVDTVATTAASVAILVWYAPWLGVVPCILTIIAFAVLIRQANRLVELNRAVGARCDAVSQNLIESVNGVRVIKSFRLEEARTKHFASDVEAFVREALGALRFASRRIPISQVIVALGHVWVLVYGAILVGQQRLGVGELVAALLTVNTLVQRFEGVGPVVQTFADARSSAARIWELFDARTEIVTGKNRLASGALGLQFDRVRVGSPGGGNDILRDVSFTIEPGEIVALVGNTGSGKSTLMGLMPRLFEADSGRVLLGSSAQGWHDVRSLELGDLRRRVHVLPQETFLFTDTLAANLRLAGAEAEPDRLHHVLQLAAAGDVLAGLPAGLETKVGDRGITLSGGQRQRVCFARALLAEASVLGLDDPLSALDAATERVVLDNLRALRRDSGHPVTVLVASNKLSTILLADRVLLVADGRIAAQGTHARLAATNPAYRDLMGI